MAWHRVCIFHASLPWTSIICNECNFIKPRQINPLFVVSFSIHTRLYHTKPTMLRCWIFLQLWFLPPSLFPIHFDSNTWTTLERTKLRCSFWWLNFDGVQFLWNSTSYKKKISNLFIFLFSPLHFIQGTLTNVSLNISSFRSSCDLFSFLKVRTHVRASRYCLLTK